MTANPLACLRATLFLAPGFVLLAWLGNKRSNWLLAAVIVASLAFMSNLMILRDGDPYLNTQHYEVFVYPLIQDWLGDGVYCEQASQYGMYPAFLTPIWLFTGGPTTFAVSTTMALLLTISNASLVVFMQRHTHFSINGIAFAFVAILFSMLCIPGFWPNHAYFQFFPIRLVFPALAMLFICLRPQSVVALTAAYTAIAFGLFWNLESGLVALSALGTYCLAMEPTTSTRGLLRAAGKHAALMCFGAMAATLCVNAYTILRFQQFLNPSLLSQMVRAFTAGFGALPMPLHGVWCIHLAIYACSVFVGIRLIAQSQLVADRDRAAAMLATAMMGVMFFTYYQGRSAPHQLAVVTFPAIMCLGLVVDQAIARLVRHGAVISCGLATLLVTPVVAALIIWLMGNPFPHRGIHAPSALANNDIRLRTELIARVFQEYKQEADDRCVVVSPYTHFVQLHFHQASPIHATGITNVILDAEMAELRNALLSSHTRVAVFDQHWIQNFPLIREALDQYYMLSDAALGCSTCKVPDMRVYIRKNSHGVMNAALESDRLLAIAGPLSQSTTGFNGDASKATDGNTDGNWSAGTISHTGLYKDPWWQADIGESVSIRTIRIWNRVDGYSDRLKGFWVFVSDYPFDDTVTLEDLSSSPNVVKVYCADMPCPSASLRLPFGTQGRYVRVQLQGTGYLCLAEVQLFGPPGSPGLLSSTTASP